MGGAQNTKMRQRLLAICISSSSKSSSKEQQQQQAHCGQVTLALWASFGAMPNPTLTSLPRMMVGMSKWSLRMA
jgi:hypothetical protein